MNIKLVAEQRPESEVDKEHNQCSRSSQALGRIAAAANTVEASNLATIQPLDEREDEATEGS